MSQVILVFDLGPGDGGKGGIVHKLSCHYNAHTIIKVGGAQGSHGVFTNRHKFAFSQWGCGTFEGVNTHITPLMVVSPEGLLNEADALRYSYGIDAFDLLTVDERAICTTPYHGIASRIKELARGLNHRGTIGTGVGEAFRDSINNKDETIFVKDLKHKLGYKLSRVRNRLCDELRNIVASADFLHDDIDIVNEEMSLLEDGNFLDHCVDRFYSVGKVLNIVDDDYMSKKIINRHGTSIVESSHGVLTDNLYGFYPHVSAIRTLPQFACDMLIKSGFYGELKKIGVHRAYSIRHGAGPMPTYDPNMNCNLLPGSHKDDNRYQGNARVGPIDLVLMRYAIDVCGGPGEIDGLAISWFDQISKNGVWRVCDGYDNIFYDFNRIKIFKDEYGDQREYQQKLCSLLFGCKPIISSFVVPDSNEEQYLLCDRVLRDKLGVPTFIVSFGPTERDKLMKGF